MIRYSSAAAMLLLAGAAAAEPIPAAVLRVEHGGPGRSRGSTCRPRISASPARGSPSPTTTPPAASWARSSPWPRSRCRPRRRWRRCEALIADGVRFVATMADADTTLALADAAGPDGAGPERARPRRPAARRGLPGEPAAPRAEPVDADRRAGAVPDGQALEPTGSWSRARTRRTRRSPTPTARSAEKFGARDRRDPGLRGHRRRPAHRFRPRAGAGADAGLHPARARARRGGRRRRERGLRRLPALPHLGRRARSPGSAGLDAGRPGTRRMEAWGGTQLQTRFEEQSSRPMRPEDYNAWMALRAVGEAATRTQLDRPRDAARTTSSARSSSSASSRASR